MRYLFLLLLFTACNNHKPPADTPVPPPPQKQTEALDARQVLIDGRLPLSFDYSMDQITQLYGKPDSIITRNDYDGCNGTQYLSPDGESTKATLYFYKKLVFIQAAGNPRLAFLFIDLRHHSLQIKNQPINQDTRPEWIRKHFPVTHERNPMLNDRSHKLHLIVKLKTETISTGSFEGLCFVFHQNQMIYVKMYYTC